MSELAAEDSLRLHILLANQPLAIRIDERRLTLHALTSQGEMQCALHPNTQVERYLRWVRELLSSQVLDSPGGYPVYLKRWTRMGQARDEHLPQLLLLGEPEAVVAVVCAAGLTDELARRAWWAAPEADNARRMLMRPAVAQGAMGPVLAHYLLEHLAFETDPLTVMRTVQLILQPGLLTQAQCQTLWQQAQRQTACRLGFLAAGVATIPEPASARPLPPSLQALAETGHPLAQFVAQSYSVMGQTFWYQAAACLQQPVNQELVDALLQVIATFCRPARLQATLPDADWVQLQALCAAQEQQTEIAKFLTQFPELVAHWRALALLAHLNYGVVRAIFAQGTAEGTLLTRKLMPVSEVLLAQLAQLTGTSCLLEASRRRNRRG